MYEIKFRNKGAAYWVRNRLKEDPRHSVTARTLLTLVDSTIFTSDESLRKDAIALADGISARYRVQSSKR